MVFFRFFLSFSTSLLMQADARRFPVVGLYYDLYRLIQHTDGLYFPLFISSLVTRYWIV